MVTRLYFHEATSGLTNLPIAKQGDAPGPFLASVDTGTINRTMDRDIGTSPQAIKSRTTAAISGGPWEYYFTRFVSEPLTAQTISANTWTYNIGTRTSHSDCNFPVDGTDQVAWAAVYVWRPGTGLVGFIIDGNTNAEWSKYVAAIGNGFIQHTTFSGASQTTQEGDVLCQEIIFGFTHTATGRTVAIYYDGGTVNTTSGTQMGDIAAFLETPQNLSFVGDSISMDVTDTVVLTNKFIDKA